MRFLIPLLFIIAVSPAAPVFADGKTIALCYHTFIGLPWDQYDFSPAVFSNQIVKHEKARLQVCKLPGNAVEFFDRQY